VIYGENTEMILKALADEGPMTRAELCRATGLGHDYASAVLTRLSRAMTTIPKRVYITGYIHDAEGKRRYPRAVYDLGDKPDAKRPKPDKKAIRKRYDERKRNLVAGSSVFTWGMTRAQIKDHLSSFREASNG